MGDIVDVFEKHGKKNLEGGWKTPPPPTCGLGLRNELQDVIDWLRQNKLSLNARKCEFMFLGNSKQLGKISEIGDLKVGEDEIKRVRKTKYLGLTIDETLSWNQQYNVKPEKSDVYRVPRCLVLQGACSKANNK